MSNRLFLIIWAVLGVCFIALSAVLVSGCSDAKATQLPVSTFNELGPIGAISPRYSCVGGKDFLTGTMDNAPFTVNLPPRRAGAKFPYFSGGWGVMTLWIDLTDANTSITRFDVTCTVDQANGADDFTPQVCGSGSSAGTCVLADTGVWQKTSPGTKKWPIRMDVHGYPDTECTIDVGTGTGADVDALSVDYTFCVE